MPDDKIILAIVDDHPVVIEGLKTLLKMEPGINAAVSFTRGREFLSFLKENEVHIVLLDIMLPDANGIELCKEIRKVSPDTAILALSNQAERSIILQMLHNGANGYLLKNASAEELIGCIHKALDGGIAFSREVQEIVSRPSPNDLKGIPAITKREKQILQMIADGKTTAIIAEELILSPLTIDTHRRNLLQKFEVNNVAELIRTAMQLKLL